MDHNNFASAKPRRTARLFTGGLASLMAATLLMGTLASGAQAQNASGATTPPACDGVEASQTQGSVACFDTDVIPTQNRRDTDVLNPAKLRPAQGHGWQDLGQIRPSIPGIFP